MNEHVLAVAHTTLGFKSDIIFPHNPVRARHDHGSRFVFVIGTGTGASLASSAKTNKKNYSERRLLAYELSAGFPGAGGVHHVFADVCEKAYNIIVVHTEYWLLLVRSLVEEFCKRWDRAGRECCRSFLVASLSGVDEIQLERSATRYAPGTLI